MILNEAYDFSDVRYLISSRAALRMPRRKPDGTRDVEEAPKICPISYDVDLTFVRRPDKTRLYPGTVLARLDFPVSFSFFSNVWWMRRETLDAMLKNTGADAAALRQAWQHSAAMPGKDKGVRTLIVEIVLIQEVFAWVGTAAPAFNKRGGAEQVYLPNLSHGWGSNRSDYASVFRTSTLPAI